jgi:hypothetical protein
MRRITAMSRHRDHLPGVASSSMHFYGMREVPAIPLRDRGLSGCDLPCRLIVKVAVTKCHLAPNGTAESKSSSSQGDLIRRSPATLPTAVLLATAMPLPATTPATLPAVSPAPAPGTSTATSTHQGGQDRDDHADRQRWMRGMRRLGKGKHPEGGQAGEQGAPMSKNPGTRRTRSRVLDRCPEGHRCILAAVPGVQASRRCSRQAARPVSTTAYPQSTANPVHGPS